MNFRSILLKILVLIFTVILILTIIILISGFNIQKNSMDYFFSQHTKLDSSLFDEKLTRKEILSDIDFLISTIEEVHPAPYTKISKTNFYLYADSIKSELTDQTRKELFRTLIPLLKSLEDGHTGIMFPEISSGQDNKTNFDSEHLNPKEVITYQNFHNGIGYLFIKDFVVDRIVFISRLDTVFRKIKIDSIQNLIIDIRNNPGGNSELADDLVSYIYDKPYRYSSKIQIKRSKQYYKYMKGYFSWWFRPFLDFVKTFRNYKKTPVGEMFEEIKGTKKPRETVYQFSGKKYLLINGNTFSTALGFATIFKDYKIGTIIGEQTKAAVNGFGDIYAFDLPNSGLWVWCSAKRYIRPSGELTTGGLKPDICILDDEDKIMKYTLEFIKNDK